MGESDQALRGRHLRRPGPHHRAIRLLKANYDETQRTHYRRLTSEFDSILARAYLKDGDLDQAAQYAQSAVRQGREERDHQAAGRCLSGAVRSRPAARRFADALAFHEKYATADKGYLNDTSARTLAFQMVNQQVLDKKRQIDALNEKNQVLQLQQKVDAKSAETKRLYILLLLSGSRSSRCGRTGPSARNCIS